MPHARYMRDIEQISARHTREIIDRILDRPCVAAQDAPVKTYEGDTGDRTTPEPIPEVVGTLERVAGTITLESALGSGTGIGIGSGVAEASYAVSHAAVPDSEARHAGISYTDVSHAKIPHGDALYTDGYHPEASPADAQHTGALHSMMAVTGCSSMVFTGDGQNRSEAGSGNWSEKFSLPAASLVSRHGAGESAHGQREERAAERRSYRSYPSILGRKWRSLCAARQGDLQDR